MRAVSAAWKRTVTGSHTPVTRVTLCQSFQTGSSPVGDRIDIMDGLVTHDGSADVYGRMDLTVDGKLWPTSYGDTRLAPYGVEAFVQVGIQYSDDLVELLGLGYFRLRVLGQPDLKEPIRLTGQDRMGPLIKAGLLQPRSYPSSTLVSDFVDDLVLDVYPDAVIEYDEDAGSRTLGRDIVAEDSRYLPLAALAKSLGMRVYWDHTGTLVFRLISSDSKPVATLKSGRDGTLVRAARELNADQVVNAIVATGNGTDSTGTVTGYALDSNPASPTNYYSFGPSPDFINTPLLTTPDECRLAAQAELYRVGGLPYSLSPTISPRHELMPFDSVLVEAPGVLETHVLSVVPHPLMPGQVQDIQTRQQLITIVGA